ncbi:YkvI family membrane protein [Lentibacillus saliphilus]|uniref:YkvI family membrane protein n=1 Tax=Lentibacillus saliphilus TaxID=2737028 RepID=UPI001C2F806A|nr:hypothetical protein [Lentibacillus saliphilus]
MKEILKIGSAFIGIIVGAGFASGQEILQYFTSFGYWGIAGAIVATALFAFLGMTITRLGSRLKAESHKDVIYTISGRYLGLIVDYIIIMTLFGVGVVMIAGAGSIFSQQFGLSAILGTMVMTTLVILTIMLDVERVVSVIGSITPFLLIAILGIAVYSLMTLSEPFSILNPIAQAQETTLPNWFVSAINYVSFNIAVGVSMALVMGGAEQNEKKAALGGLLGGLGIGILIMLSHLAIFSKIKTVANVDMPTLQIVNDISPVLGILMAVILFCMIFNTAVSMFFSFGARFTTLGTPQFKRFVIITVLVGFAASFVGFTDLVALFYPFIGYLGLFLILTLLIATVRQPGRRAEKSRPQ